MAAAISSWASWVVNVATETVNEIIAEGKQELAAASGAAASSSPASTQQSMPRAVWDPLPASGNPSVGFWQRNPMQWSCLMRCVALDINTFMIPKAACLEQAETAALLKEIGVIDSAASSSVTLNKEPKRKMIKESEALAMLRYDLVPRWVDEDDFWVNLAWRAEVLAATSSVEQAVNLLRLLNTEHRQVFAAAAESHAGSSPESGATKSDDADAEATDAAHVAEQRKEDEAALLASPNPARPAALLDRFLLSSLKHITATTGNGTIQRVPYADVLRRRGFGAAQPDAALMHELAERIHATGEKEAWINNFTARATKQLESVHSSVVMMTKLLAEVDAILRPKAASSSSSSPGGSSSASPAATKQAVDDADELDLDSEQDGGDTDAEAAAAATAAVPSLDLLQSVAESCKFNKGRIAALLGELESSPPERVAGTPLDPGSSGAGASEGALCAELKQANQRLALALAQEMEMMRAVSEAVRKSQDREHSSSSTAAAAAAASPASGRGATAAATASASSGAASPKGDLAFTAAMPWDDDDE